MSLRLIDWYAGCLLTVLALIVLHAPLTVWASSMWPDYSDIIKAWKEIVLVVATILAAGVITRHRAWRRLSGDWLLRLSALYALLHLALLPFFDSNLSMLAAGLAIDLRYILAFCLFYILIVLEPDWWRRVKQVAIAGAVIVLGFACLQLFLPIDTLRSIGYGDATIQPYLTVDSNEDYVRHNSTLRGPNPLGAYAASVIIIAACVLFRQSRKWQLWLLVVAGFVALYISYSRSAALALAAGLLVVFYVKFADKIRARHVAGLLVAAVIGVAGLLYGVNNSVFLSQLVLHEDPTEGGMVNSNDAHLSSLVNSADRIDQLPFGAGIGSTGSASLYGERPLIIENQYLFVAHETGWLGLALFVALFGLIMYRLWQSRDHAWALGLFASGVGLAIIGIFLPVWADDTVSIVWWSLAGAVVAYCSQKKAGKNV